MYVGRNFDPADPSDAEVFGLDFVGRLPVGDTLASAVWSCRVAADSIGQDATPASRLSGASQISGTVSLQKVAGLVAGVKYVLEAVATTGAGEVVTLHSHVTCLDPLAAS